jgi:general secretion pathway protein D
LIQEDDRKNRSTVPILGDLPYLGELFTATTVDRVETEVVLTITPRIVRSLTTPPIAEQAFWSGTDQTYATTQLFPPYAQPVSQSKRSDAVTGTSAVVVAPPTTSNAVPSTGTLPVPPATIRGASPAAPSAGSSSSDLVASGPALIRLSPAELSTKVGQEFQVDLSTLSLEALTESMVTVSYDPTLVEFRRVGPGTAAITARSTDGQVIVTMRRQGTEGTGESVLAMLFFQAKAKGEGVLTMETAPPDAGPPTGGKAIVHVQ